MRRFRALLLTLLPALPAAADAQDPTPYDVVWQQPSRDATGSMPIGNGEVGCNVWCEDGRMHFYVSRTDSFSEASRLLKLGGVTIHVTPRPAGAHFEQRLLLQEGRIQVTLGDGEDRIVLELFVDATSDVVHVTTTGKQPHRVLATLWNWRQRPRMATGDDGSWTMKGAPAGALVPESADVVLDEASDAAHTRGEAAPRHLGWLHHNRASVVAATAARQGLPASAVDDVLAGRTFGLLTSPGARLHPSLETAGHVHWSAEAATRHELRLAAPCLQVEDQAKWTAHARALLAATDTTTARARTAAWWRAFWQRSWIAVAGDPPAGTGVPRNTHPLRIGVDSNGGNRFVGSIAGVMLQGGPFTADLTCLAIESPYRAPLLQAAPGADLPLVATDQREIDLAGGIRIVATITQDAQHPTGRIVDKVTAGTSDGFLFDTHPGRSLRLIVGDRQLLAKDVLQPGRQHVVMAQFDERTGRMQLACDGEVVADSATSAAPSDPTPPSRLTQALVLQRWIQACGGRGRFPIKFNGSIFTVEPKAIDGSAHDADWRKWGDCFWWQNTRLPYHPMLAQGDFDMQDALFAFYRRTLPAAVARVTTWHGKAGAYWPEVMTPFGTHANGDYGWQRDGLPASKVQCPWWEYARNQGLELLALALDRYDYTRDDAFFRDQVLPLAGPVLAWFESAYARETDGTLRITPTQALETHWHGVVNDLPTVAGLHWCLRRLGALAPQLVPPDQLTAWAAFARTLPPIPTRTVDGATRLVPAAAYDASRQNCESPELYAVFPFRVHGLGKPDLDVARATYAARHDRFTNGWPQDGQLAALLGLVDDARANVLAKVRNHHPAHRFPAMWGPNFDWCPDQCHGSNLLDTVQRMLLQCDDGRIRVLPCWPREWDVSFRLHAPQRTVVECEFRGGRITRLAVAPPERGKDVVLPQ